MKTPKAELLIHVLQYCTYYDTYWNTFQYRYCSEYSIGAKATTCGKVLMITHSRGSARVLQGRRSKSMEKGKF